MWKRAPRIFEPSARGRALIVDGSYPGTGLKSNRQVSFEMTGCRVVHCCNSGDLSQIFPISSKICLDCRKEADKQPTRRPGYSQAWSIAKVAAIRVLPQPRHATMIELLAFQTLFATTRWIGINSNLSSTLSEMGLCKRSWAAIAGYFLHISTG